MEEPNSWETRRVEGLGGVKRPVGDTQKTHGPEHPPPETPAERQMRGVKVMLRKIPLQKREEGLRYCSRSSFSKPEDSEASVKDLSLGSNGEDLSNGSPEKKARETGPTGNRQGSGDELIVIS